MPCLESTIATVLTSLEDALSTFIIPCLHCDPYIPGALKVTFSGLAGDFAYLNGSHTLHYTLARDSLYQGTSRECTWRKFAWDPGGFENLTENYRIDLFYSSTGPKWILKILVDESGAGSECSKRWIKTVTAETRCDPTGSYTEDTCDASYCPDSDTCTDSAGATAVISYYSPAETHRKLYDIDYLPDQSGECIEEVIQAIEDKVYEITGIDWADNCSSYSPTGSDFSGCIGVVTDTILDDIFPTSQWGAPLYTIGSCPYYSSLSCPEPVPDTITVTISNAAKGFVDANGTHTLTWNGSDWRTTVSGLGYDLYITADRTATNPYVWYVQALVTSPGGCAFYLVSEGGALWCDPRGITFDHLYSCVDDGCGGLWWLPPDGDSCEDSYTGGVQATISYT